MRNLHLQINCSNVDNLLRYLANQDYIKIIKGQLKLRLTSN